MAPTPPLVVLQVPVEDALCWARLESPRAILQASSHAEVHSVLAQAESAAEAGLVVAGFVTYDAAPAFDAALEVGERGSLPLTWFGVFERLEILETLPSHSGLVPTLRWQTSISRDRYSRAVEAIRDHIAKGDTYQVNLTLRLVAGFDSDPWPLFASLCRGQRSRCCAFIDTGDWAICSASPELFFHLEGTRLWSRPMKGTAPRGRTADEDERSARWLLASAKNRAENVMIVDMVRHDLGKIAVPGSVKVPHLGQLERYPSLFQLTSTVEAMSEASLIEIFAALFPCASITGAPKVRATQIIAELEDRPRGVYTGAIGIIGPGRRARFSVAIRTVHIDRLAGRAEYGTGGGIVWDSRAEEEWLECHTKALVLQSPAPEFELFETLRWDPRTGYFLLQRHLGRLAASASYFDYSFDVSSARCQLADLASTIPPSVHRVRMLLNRDGRVSLETEPLREDPSPWRIALASHPIDSQDRFLFHKTTYRQVYETHRREFETADDVILWNRAQEVTESTVANVVVRRHGRLVTPPVECGLLAGTFRAELIANGTIHEERIRVDELDQADEILLINSLRGWIRTQPAMADSGRSLETPHPQPA